jgi:hypothetical protein
VGYATALRFFLGVTLGRFTRAFETDSGNRVYIITVGRITSGDVLKYRNGLAFIPKAYGAKSVVRKPIPLTLPSNPIDQADGNRQQKLDMQTAERRLTQDDLASVQFNKVTHNGQAEACPRFALVEPGARREDDLVRFRRQARPVVFNCICVTVAVVPSCLRERRYPSTWQT